MTNLQNTIKTYKSYSIDSLCIRVELKEVSNIDLTKIGKILEVNEVTGQIINTKNQSYKHTFNELINVYFSIIEYQLNGTKYKKLQILLSSKILTKSYFIGITKQNISYIYRKIQSFNIASFTLQTFLNSNVYDVDIKKDIKSIKQDSIIILTTLKNRSKTEFQYKNTIENPTKKDNLGLLYGNRTGNKNKDVNLKFYQKDIELKTRSYSFFKQYFAKQHMPETIRAEFNIKNAQRFIKLGINKKFTLNNILNLKQSEINKMYNTVVNYHIINPNEMEPKTKKTGNTKSQDLIEMLLCTPNNNDYYLGLQEQYIYAQKWINERIKEKSKKSRLLKEIESKYDELSNKKQKDLTNEKAILKTLKQLFN